MATDNLRRGQGIRLVAQATVCARPSIASRHRNPADAASPPAARGSSPELRVWTAEELRTFLAGSRAHRGRGGKIGIDRLYCAWVVAATTGLRRGELLGLRGRDVDLDRGVLSVLQTVGLVNKDGRGTIGCGVPKTDQSR